MQTGRLLSADQLTAARRAYEAGATFQALADQLGVSYSCIRGLLVALGCVSRPRGFERGTRPRKAPPRPRTPPRPQPRPAVEIIPAPGRLRIPLRTPEQRRVRDWLPAELQAIAYELAAGRFVVIRRGRSGLPESSTATWDAARFAFYIAMQKVKRAA
jgi:hypothetical protein